MVGSKPRVIQDPTWGYRRVEPIPEPDELARYYESKYCDDIRKGKGAPDLARLLAGGPDADRERAWLRETLYADILTVLDAQVIGKERTAIDVGCGVGEFVEFLHKSSWKVVGTEPSVEVAAVGRLRGLDIRSLGLEEFVDSWRAGAELPFAVATLLNVLEHVPDPVRFLRRVDEVIAPSGLLVVRVPNDFNEFQLSAQRTLNKEPWWVAVPQHINYFDFGSIASLLSRLGWEVIHRQGDFPMELFLLMGDDYVANPAVGSMCHERRRRFELGIPSEVRRAWYRSLANEGLGRNCLIIARRGTS